jgi:hypothetical protein
MSAAPAQGKGWASPPRRFVLRILGFRLILLQNSVPAVSPPTLNKERKAGAPLVIELYASNPRTRPCHPPGCPYGLKLVPCFFLLAEVLGIRMDSPLFELRVGPLYPTERVIDRESVLAFMTNYQMQYSLGFQAGSTLRHPAGTILARQDSSSKYMNIGGLATLHYIEPLRQAREIERVFTQADAELRENLVFPFWSITAPMLRAIGVAANLFKCSGLTCDVRIEAALRNVSKLPFTLSINSWPFDTLEVQTVSAHIPASVTHPSETLAERVQQITTELLYQLRWPFGTEKPHTREEIDPIVAKMLPSAKVRY